jgi:hypothetical protein
LGESEKGGTDSRRKGEKGELTIGEKEKRGK